MSQEGTRLASQISPTVPACFEKPYATAAAPEKELQDNVLRLLTCPMGCRVFHNHSQWVCVRSVSEMCQIRGRGFVLGKREGTTFAGGPFVTEL
jgi:hypothetical protein